MIWKLGKRVLLFEVNLLHYGIKRRCRENLLVQINEKKKRVFNLSIIKL